MRNLLYFLALIFVILWAVSFFFFMAGAIVHVLLLAAVVAIGIKLYKLKIRRQERLKEKNKLKQF